VPIHEVGEQDGVPYAVLELIEDGTLEDFLAEVRGLDLSSARAHGEARLPGEGSYEQRVAELLAQVAETVHSIHEAGIVHRDIKPANLLVASARGCVAREKLRERQRHLRSYDYARSSKGSSRALERASSS